MDERQQYMQACVCNCFLSRIYFNDIYSIKINEGIITRKLKFQGLKIDVVGVNTYEKTTTRVETKKFTDVL